MNEKDFSLYIGREAVKPYVKDNEEVNFRIASARYILNLESWVINLSSRIAKLEHGMGSDEV